MTAPELAIHAQPCECPPGVCAAFVDPPDDCVGRLRGRVCTEFCEACDSTTWHHEGECLRCARLARITLPSWVIYDRPTDCPHCVIARKWELRRGELRATEAVMMADHADTLRAVFEAWGLARLAAEPRDESQIVESWF